MKIKCQQCGEEFEAKRRDAKFCSPKCRKRASKGIQQKSKCIICGNEFITNGPQRYCCEDCSEIARINDKMNKDFTENSYFDAEYDSENYDEDFGGVDYGDY